VGHRREAARLIALRAGGSWPGAKVMERRLNSWQPERRQPNYQGGRMKSFEQWTREIKPDTTNRGVSEEDLPEGLFGDAETGFYFYCRSCDKSTDFEGDKPEDFHRDGAYCGRSQFCMP